MDAAQDSDGLPLHRVHHNNGQACGISSGAARIREEGLEAESIVRGLLADFAYESSVFESQDMRAILGGKKKDEQER